MFRKIKGVGQMRKWSEDKGFVEELLGRKPVSVNLEKIYKSLKGKTILVTGGGGSIGGELCRQIAKAKPACILIMDIYENGAYEIQQELLSLYPDLDLKVLIGSVRSSKRLDEIFEMYHPDIVYHAAAHKHVPLMEENPKEAVKNNVFGTYKTALASHQYGASRFVLISTDKAVKPVSVMGATKRICEMIIQMMNERSRTEFSAVRFGNVMGSSGSVIPLFEKEIQRGGPVTVTHPEVTRYFMTIQEAVSLVLQAGACAKGGEIRMLDMGEPVKILTVAEKMIEMHGLQPGKDIEIRFTGLRPGEKLHEELTGGRDSFDFGWFEKKLAALWQSLDGNTDIRGLLKELVSGYDFEEKDAPISFSPPDISEWEIQAVAETLRSGWITTGPKTRLFEQEIADFCGTGKAVCLSSATAGMELLLRVLGIGPGDEVITCAYTYTATASPVLHVGAKLVLVDTLPGSFEINYKQAEAAVTEKTKAIIAVDLGGMLCNYEKLFEIAEKKRTLFHPSSELQKKMGRMAVVADSAHAFGASRGTVKCGNLADFTSFSFHAVKNLTTAEGGALTWKDSFGVGDDVLYEYFSRLSMHGQSKDAFAKTGSGSWEYDIVFPGYKCNMTDIAASIGLAQLQRYPGMLKRRREIIARYDSAFEKLGLILPRHFHGEYISSGHLYPLRFPGISEKKRNQMIEMLKERGIPANVHYKPLPLMTAYRELGYDWRDYPNAMAQYENEISLPLHSRLSTRDVERICGAVAAVFREVSE